jgi:uncharacterized LabA/DUF88 family protein
MHFSARERTALFIDGINLYGATKTLGFDVDFRRLLEVFRLRTRLVRALYYTVEVEGSSVRALLDWLNYNGFTVVTKPAKEVTDSMSPRRGRDTMDVELTVDALLLSEQLDHVVLFCGGAEFVSLVAGLQQLGKRVSVVSSLISQPPLVADQLRRQADQFIDLVDLQPIISRGTIRGAPSR